MFAVNPPKFAVRVVRAFCAALLVLGAGCYRERSVTLAPHSAVVVGPPAAVADARTWLEMAHQRLAPLLPVHTTPALLTRDLRSAPGESVDVYRHFHRSERLLGSPLFNPVGILYTAQASRGHGPAARAAPWPEFDDVWVPVQPGLELAGRLGLARRDGEVIDADCIVVLPGLYGDNTALRMQDFAFVLRELGFHVLALEPRGHGQTQRRYPDEPYSYGVLETNDLLAVSRWLSQRSEVARVGLVGFCWGGFTGLLAACEAGRESQSANRAFAAGIIAVSPPIDFRAVADRLETRWSALRDPVYRFLGDIVALRAQAMGLADVGFSLRRLFRAELTRAIPDCADPVAFAERFLDLRCDSATSRLEAARMPVLVIHGSDDPVESAQPLADLIAHTGNSNVAAVVLPGGGHCGFAPYSRRYFYSLVASFFDEHSGAAAAAHPRVMTAEGRRSARDAGSM